MRLPFFALDSGRAFHYAVMMNWTTHFSDRTRSMKPSAIREVLKLTQASKVISFAGGLPAPSLFPVEQLAQASNKVLLEQGAQALQYSTTEGYLPLREWVAARHHASVESVQIVSGSQQGLDMVAKVLLNPGDKVVVTAPTYMGALRAFDAYQVEYLTVGIDDEGVRLDELEQALSQKPKMLYLIANFDNPTGISMSLARREAVIGLAQKYAVPIYEDDPYGELRFEGDALPTLYSLAPNHVVYGGSFSKIMAPGFRLGWILADPELLQMVTRAKQAADLHSSSFTQMVAYEVSRDGFMDTQIERVRAYYKRQRDLMLAAMAEHFPAELYWTRPVGGMFVWVTLPEGQDALELLREAVAHGVAYVHGEPFFANGGGENSLRLSYSVATPEEVQKGISALATVLKKAMPVLS